MLLDRVPRPYPHPAMPAVTLSLPAAASWRHLVVWSAITLLGLSWYCAAVAADDPLTTVTIEHVFARATPPGAHSGGVSFMVINGGNEPVVLTGASSPVASHVELHQMSMDNGVMKMCSAPSIEIAAHATVSLEASGYHVMLTDLRQPLTAGDRFPLHLTFGKLGSTEVSVVVQPLGVATPSTPTAK
jgi:periplasmic copper chaperone A